MKRIYFATTNNGKLLSLSKRMKKFGIEVEKFEIEMPEPRSYDLREIASKKVLSAFEHIKQPCVAMDAGFFIHSQNGFPRTFVNFALETIGLEGILKLAAGPNRKCEFKNCLAYFDSTLYEPVLFESAISGTLSEIPCGSENPRQLSRLHQVFIPDGYSKTLAEFSEDEYSSFIEIEMSSGHYAELFGSWFLSHCLD